MRLTAAQVLLGFAVIAASFWGTLVVRDYLESPSESAPASPSAWNEALYLAVNADVMAAIARKDFKSGREHWELAGKAERREGGIVPPDWNEARYLKLHPDVAAAVSQGAFLSGYHHYLAAGRAEKRTGGFPPGRKP